MTKQGWFAAVACVVSVVWSVGAARAQGYSVVGVRDAAAPSGSLVSSGADAGVRLPTSSSEGHAVVTPVEGATEVPSREGAVRSGRHPWEYGGLVPGRDGRVPGLGGRMARLARDRVVVAWPGFQVTPEGSRIFVAVTAQPTIVTERAPGRWIYRLQNAVVLLRNNRRPLETEAFDTPVRRAWLRQRGRDVELVIELRADAEPRMTHQSDGTGLQYVFIDFPRWTPPDHVPLPVRQGIRPAQPERHETAPDTSGESSVRVR